MRRRAWILAVLAVIAVGATAAWWTRGGARAEISLGHGVVMAPGETVYIGELPIATGDVSLRAANFRTITGTSADGIAVDVVTVRQGPRQSGIGVQDDISEYERVDLQAMEVAPTGASGGPPLDWIVVEVTAGEAGAWRIADLELRYRSGWHRMRTTSSSGELCILVTEAPDAFAWPAQPGGQTPDGIDPDHYSEYLDCVGGGPEF